jgi:hypothetical protein
MADLTGMMQAAAGSAGGGGEYIEDVFSTYLYTGTGAALTITNGIDLDGEGGLVWTKFRSGSFGSEAHAQIDTVRGGNFYLSSNSTIAQVSLADLITSFNSNGYTLGADATSGKVNYSAQNYVSWTFRKAPKFFDVVTYTGTGVNRTVAHNLGSVPGCIIVKRTDTTGDWQVYHRANTANPETDYLVLNDTAATADSNTRWNDTHLLMLYLALAQKQRSTPRVEPMSPTYGRTMTVVLGMTVSRMWLLAGRLLLMALVMQTLILVMNHNGRW